MDLPGFLKEWLSENNFELDIEGISFSTFMKGSDIVRVNLENYMIIQMYLTDSTKSHFFAFKLDSKEDFYHRIKSYKPESNQPGINI